jgi:hypothetical protein
MLMAGLARTEFALRYTNVRPAPLAQQRISAMNDKTIGYEQSDEEIPAYAISDETLEAAARWQDKAGSVTLSFCSGLSTCPA